MSASKKHGTSVTDGIRARSAKNYDCRNCGKNESCGTYVTNETCALQKRPAQEIRSAEPSLNRQ